METAYLFSGAALVQQRERKFRGWAPGLSVIAASIGTRCCPESVPRMAVWKPSRHSSPLWVHTRLMPSLAVGKERETWDVRFLSLFLSLDVWLSYVHTRCFTLTDVWLKLRCTVSVFFNRLFFLTDLFFMWTVCPNEEEYRASPVMPTSPAHTYNKKRKKWRLKCRNNK